MVVGEYEYVPKKEYQPVREDVEDIIRTVQSILRSKGITFRYELIGSGNRRMVTRIVNGNKGFDFDYNLVVSSMPEITAKQMKDEFTNAFRIALRKTGYEDPEDSTSVLTVKMVDKGCSRIMHSFDMAILIPSENGLFYIHHDKRSNQYSYQLRGGNIDLDAYLDEIERYYVDGWGLNRDKYLLLKNRNDDPGKRSFNLFVEAVKNVHNEMIQDRRNDERDAGEPRILHTTIDYIDPYPPNWK